MASLTSSPFRHFWFFPLLLLALMCSPKQDAPVCFTGTLEGCNLIILNIDSLRVDHLSCMGYPRATSPNIDRLAQAGICFAQARSNSSFTRESVANLFTGQYASHSGAIGWYAQPPAGLTCLAESFAQAGYATAFLSNSPVLQLAGFTQGFQVHEYLPSQEAQSRQAPRLAERLRAYIREHKQRPFMVYAHFLDPHGPYEPPPAIYRDLVGPPPPAQDRLHLYDYVRNHVHELIASGFGPGDARFEDLMGRYDAEIAHVDQAVGAIVRCLEDQGLADKTLLVVTADHGEEFLEHGFVEHAWTLYEESLRIPLIFSISGRARPAYIQEPVSVVDLYPSFVHLFALQAPAHVLDGSCLFTANRPLRFAAPEKPFLAELLIQHRNILRAVIADGYKCIASVKKATPRQQQDLAKRQHLLIAAYKQGRKKTHIWGPFVIKELYNLAEDPGERHNLAQQNPDRTQAFVSLLRTWQQAFQQSANTFGQPHDADEPVEDQLRSLGYF